jgi:hypothetical protein
MVKKPQRVYSSPIWNSTHWEWMSLVREHKARVLKNGENPIDYPNEAVAFETRNFGWILSKPNDDGKRRILVQY